jgi:hypothetical protein
MVVNCLAGGALGQIVLQATGWDKLSRNLRRAIRVFAQGWRLGPHDV